MKKIYLATLVLLITNINFGQSFLGTDAELYKGSTIKMKEVSENLQEYYYKELFKEFDKEKGSFTKKLSKNKPFATGSKYSPLSDYKELVGKEFKVTNVYPMTPKYSSDEGRYYALELHSDELGTMFYNYDSKYNHSLEFEVISEIILPEDFFCKKIDKQTDKFTQEVTYVTPSSSGFAFIKTVKNNKENVFLSVMEHGSTLNVGEKGLFILFENGEIMEFEDAKIDVDAADRGYTYSAFVPLNQSQIEVLSTQLITDNKLYIYEGSVQKEDAFAIQGYAKCMK